MYPILVDLGFWQIRSYGLVVAVAVLVGIWWSAREAERRGFARSLVDVRAPAVHRTPAAELGIGELEMGPDFGRPTITPEMPPVARVLLYGLLLLCPAKFVMRWMLQRREPTDMGTAAGARASGDA